LRDHRLANEYRQFGLEDRYARRGRLRRWLLWSATGMLAVAGILRLTADR